MEIHGYIISAYKRLFPDQFVTNTQKDFSSYKMNIYGQFLNSAKRIKSDLSQGFIKKVESASTFDELLSSFPMYSLKASAPIECFYDYYLS